MIERILTELEWAALEAAERPLYGAGEFGYTDVMPREGDGYIGALWDNAALGVEATSDAHSELALLMETARRVALAQAILAFGPEFLGLTPTTETENPTMLETDPLESLQAGESPEADEAALASPWNQPDPWPTPLPLMDANSENRLEAAIARDRQFVRLEALQGASEAELRELIDAGGPVALIEAAMDELGSRLQVLPCGCVADHDQHASDCPMGGGKLAQNSEAAPPATPLVYRDGRVERRDAEQEAAYELASADVVIPLSRTDAYAIANALELFAGIDEGENTDADELLRLSDLVRTLASAS